jgi:hypothetical protein
LLDVDAMGGMKSCRDVKEPHVLGESTIKLFFFLAKARKIWDFLLKHQDLNAIGSKFQL